MKLKKIFIVLVFTILSTACQNNKKETLDESHNIYKDFDFYNANKELLKDDINIFSKEDYYYCYMDFSKDKDEVFTKDKRLTLKKNKCLLLLSDKEFFKENYNVETINTIYDYIKSDSKKLSKLISVAETIYKKDKIYINNLFIKQKEKKIDVVKLFNKKRSEVFFNVNYLYNSKRFYTELLQSYFNVLNNNNLTYAKLDPNLNMSYVGIEKEINNIGNNLVVLERLLYKFAKQNSYLDSIALYNKDLIQNLAKNK